MTTTTHKTLRGPRGGMILCTAASTPRRSTARCSPGSRGGRTSTTPPALAVALQRGGRAGVQGVRAAGRRERARRWPTSWSARGFHVVSGGTDNHLILIDLTNKNVPGKVAAKALDRPGIELNYNSVPYDTRKPFDPSGIRLGTPSVSSRGMGDAEMKQIAGWMDRVISDADRRRRRARSLGEVRERDAEVPGAGHLGLMGGGPIDDYEQRQVRSIVSKAVAWWSALAGACLARPAPRPSSWSTRPS